MKVTRSFKVYGKDGHRQRVSFWPSQTLNFKNSIHKRNVILELFNSDMTGTNYYTIVRITSSTAEECESELISQISDGLFEDSNTGRVEEIRGFILPSPPSRR